MSSAGVSWISRMQSEDQGGVAHPDGGVAGLDGGQELMPHGGRRRLAEGPFPYHPRDIPDVLLHGCEDQVLLAA